MDDILSSIRKIISDDEARTQAGGRVTAAAEPPSPAANEPRPLAVGRVGTSSRDDILLLTDLIEEPKAGDEPGQPTTSLPLPPIDSRPAEPSPEPVPVPIAAAAPSAAPANFAASASSADQPLVESSVAGATSSAFDRLSQAIQENVMPPSVTEPGPALGADGKTIEDLVKEMLRPMLKDWLDRNLPAIVERSVEREIARLTRR
ncbi:MAG: DUF2497 domain-containing protein [Enhydrobacter sp.]|nr:MAG: DUF2497 domain-containing protein [Enhydrobacter sp.]